MSLGDGTAAFQAWRDSELPEEWRRPCEESDLHRAAANLAVPQASVFCQVVLELPDFPWAWKYQEWHRQLSDRECSTGASGGDKCVPIMLVARGEFRQADQAERERLFKQCLRAFLVDGKPPPFWAKVWGITPGAEEGRTGPTVTLAQQKVKLKPTEKKRPWGSVPKGSAESMERVPVRKPAVKPADKPAESSRGSGKAAA